MSNGFTLIKEKILLNEGTYSKVSLQARYLLMVLINRQTYHIDKDGNLMWFFCRMAWLSEILGVKRNQIYKYKKELEQYGIIETKVERDEKKQKVTYFRVNSKCLVSHT